MDNWQSAGYAILALEDVLKKNGFSFRERKKLTAELNSSMYFFFDTTSESDAESLGNIIHNAETEREMKAEINDFKRRRRGK